MASITPSKANLTPLLPRHDDLGSARGKPLDPVYAVCFAAFRTLFILSKNSPSASIMSVTTCRA